MTNHEQQGQKIIGLNTENVEINEGLIRFDIIFYVRLPSEDSKDAGLTQIIINVEAQKDEPTSYEILNRAIFMRVAWYHPKRSGILLNPVMMILNEFIPFGYV